MSTEIDFKNLWQQQEIERPDVNDLLLKIKQFKATNVKRMVWTNILLLGTAGIILFIWYSYQPELISTKVGIVLTILAILIFLLAYNQLFNNYKASSNLKSNKEYLNELIVIKQKQKFLQTTMIQLYFVLLTLGICLYLYEYVQMMPSLWGVTTYVLTLGWMAFNWVYLRPKTIKKQQHQLDKLIKKFELTNEQLIEK